MRLCRHVTSWQHPSVGGGVEGEQSQHERGCHLKKCTCPLPLSPHFPKPLKMVVIKPWTHSGRSFGNRLSLHIHPSSHLSFRTRKVPLARTGTNDNEKGERAALSLSSPRVFDCAALLTSRPPPPTPPPLPFFPPFPSSLGRGARKEPIQLKSWW
jgi:hypothetical protein